MGQEGEEGDLADIGAFPGHVGAGDESDLLGGKVQLNVVGDEALFGQGLVEDGMAAIQDLQDSFVAPRPGGSN